MKIILKKNKYLIFVFGSWIVAKLQWTFEMSRLAFFRSNRLAEIRFVVRQSRTMPACIWNYEEERFTVIEFDQFRQKFILNKLQKINKN